MRVASVSALFQLKNNNAIRPVSTSGCSKLLEFYEKFVQAVDFKSFFNFFEFKLFFFVIYSA